MTKNVIKNMTELRAYRQGKHRISAVVRLRPASIQATTNKLKFPPIRVMINKYTAMVVVRIYEGTRSTTRASVTPIHISPIMLEKMRL